MFILLANKRIKADFLILQGPPKQPTATARGRPPAAATTTTSAPAVPRQDDSGSFLLLLPFSGRHRGKNDGGHCCETAAATLRQPGKFSNYQNNLHFDFFIIIELFLQDPSLAAAVEVCYGEESASQSSGEGA